MLKKVLGLNKAYAVLKTCLQTSRHREKMLAIFGIALWEKAFESIYLWDVS